MPKLRSLNGIQKVTEKYYRSLNRGEVGGYTGQADDMALLQTSII